jgi:hypothetical protein
MKESKGLEMNGEQTTAEGSCVINNQQRTQTMCSAEEIKGHK